MMVCGPLSYIWAGWTRAQSACLIIGEMVKFLGQGLSQLRYLNILWGLPKLTDQLYIEHNHAFGTTRWDLVGIGTNGVIGLSYEGGQRVSSHASSLHLSFIGFPTTEDSIAPLPCFQPLTPLEKEGMAVFNLQIMSDLSKKPNGLDYQFWRIIPRNSDQAIF